MDKETSISKRLPITRRTLLGVSGVSGITALAGCQSSDADTDDTQGDDDPEDTETESTESVEFEFVEGTVEQAHAAIAADELTVEELIQGYLDRIDSYDEDLNSLLHINEDALDRARELDDTLAESGPVGPLHGIPVILKDNCDTGDMPTTGGSKTMEGVVPPDDATLVRELREAGAIIIAKANMHEFAWRWETYSSLGGQTPTPYTMNHVSGGSSGGSGAAIAANFGILSIGTDTCGSTRVPAAFNNAVGIRGTLGLVSRDGVMPMSTLQDIAGPITRTVADAAAMLDVIAGYDPADPSTARTIGATPVDDGAPITTALAENEPEHAEPSSYTDYLNEDGLEDAGIGVIREYIDEEDDRKMVADVVEVAIDEMADAGATIVDPVEVPPADNSLTFPEFHRDLNGYLATLDHPDAPANLQEIVDQPEQVHPSVLATLESSVQTSIEDMDEDVDYLQDIIKRSEYRVMNDIETEPGNRQQILVTMAENDLDALLYPCVSAPPVEIPEDEPPVQPADSVHCTLSAGTGLPAITFPGGFTEDGLPVGLELIGRPFTEGKLIELAYAYEQATGHRVPPDGFESLA